MIPLLSHFFNGCCYSSAMPVVRPLLLVVNEHPVAIARVGTFIEPFLFSGTMLTLFIIATFHRLPFEKKTGEVGQVCTFPLPVAEDDPRRGNEHAPERSWTRFPGNMAKTGKLVSLFHFRLRTLRRTFQKTSGSLL